MKLSLAHVRQLEARVAALEKERDIARANSPQQSFYFTRFGMERSAFAAVINVSLRLENGRVVLRGGDVEAASGPYADFLAIIDKWPR